MRLRGWMRETQTGSRRIRAGIPAGGDAGDKTVYGMSGGLASFPVDYPEGADVGYRWYAARNRKPLFPFGFGLT